MVLPVAVNLEPDIDPDLDPSDDTNFYARHCRSVRTSTTEE